MTYTTNRHPVTHKIHGGLITIAVLALLALVVIGGWQLNWWLAGSTASHRANVARHNDGRQTAYIDQARNLNSVLAGIDVQIQQSPDQAAPLTAQRKALRDQFCAMANTIDDPPNDVSVDAAREAC